MEKSTFNIFGAVRFYQESGEVILLESQKGDHPSSTKSYLAARPRAWIKSFGEEIQLFEHGELIHSTGNPWDALEAFCGKHKDWMFGYLGYDLKNSIEKLSSGNQELYHAPDMYFMIPDVLIEVSNTGEYTFLKGEEESVFYKETDSFRVTGQQLISRKSYITKVEKALADIAEGEYYEVNISHPIRYSFEGDAFALYQKMKQRGPVPFASFLSMEGLNVCCSSPERFLAKRGEKVWSQPIKGTISRSAENDDHSKTMLHTSEKNRAENLMIVDLVRNDLNRVAVKGSVRVKDLFEIQSFESVHQMVSTVECEVPEAAGPIEIIKACFPMGSMTGAPKIAAMEYIEHIEDYKRGIYSGAIGYIKPNQDFDFNVVIRTAIIQDGTLTYPVGGAITSDSIPEEEWEETLVKARALTNSLD